MELNSTAKRGFRTEVKPGVPAVELDPRMIRQALFNVVMNALQAMSGRGALQLSAAVDGEDFVRITVSDSGPGISKAIADRVFEPFFTTRGFGAGLGLAVVKRFIEMREDGSVSVEPLEQGTTLALRLPLNQAPETDAPAGLLPERRPRSVPPLS